MTKDDVRQDWAAAERAAVDAEMKVAAIGQAAQDPRVAELCRSATQLRAEADRLLGELAQADLEDGGPAS